jgi:hypothetical protein
MDPLARPDVDFNKWTVTEQYQAGESSTTPPDVLSSKLLIGEFVILSQNYTSSEAHRSVLAENIVKLVSTLEYNQTGRQCSGRFRNGLIILDLQIPLATHHQLT